MTDATAASNQAKLSKSALQEHSVLVSYAAAADLPELLRKGIEGMSDRMVIELEARGIVAIRVNAAFPDRSAAETLKDAAGVVVMGGVDIDPGLYGEEVVATNLYLMDPGADAYEVALVQEASRCNKPVFGICRGSQIINVAMGGTLIQDLGPSIHVAKILDRDSTPDDVWTNHEVTLTRNSKLEKMLGARTIDVRVGHHQAVDQVGSGLVVSARAADGVIEAIEADASWILGVQWHPEEKNADPTAFGNLLDGYAAAIRASLIETTTEFTHDICS